MKKAERVKKIAADFETTATEPARVWAFAYADINTPDDVTVCNSIADFFDLIEKTPEKLELYFHNLKFDGSFIITELYNRGYKYTPERPHNGEFRAFFSEGELYYIEIKTRGRRSVTYIYDSLKILPVSIESLGECIGIKKQAINYNTDEINKNNINYIRDDVTILAKSLKYFYTLGLDGITISNAAYTDFISTYYNTETYKSQHKKDRAFREDFPCLDSKKVHTYKLSTVMDCCSSPDDLEAEVISLDEYIRRAYFGGICIVNKQNKDYNEQKEELETGEGIVLDINSLYPYVMQKYKYYGGIPQYFEGFYNPLEIFPDINTKYLDEKLNLPYIQHVLLNAHIKEGGIPCLPYRKKGWLYKLDGQEYIWLDHTEGMQEFYLTSTDLKNVLNNYDIYDIFYIDGIVWTGCPKSPFSKYIDKWYSMKKNSTGAIRQVCKLMLNSLYGKFGQKTKHLTSVPVLDDSGKLILKQGEPTVSPSIYTALSVFISAYARNEIITAAEYNFDHLCYIDTDSLHLNCTAEQVEHIEISDEIGAFKIENRFDRARFVKPKCYIEQLGNDVSDIYDIKMAGLRKSIPLADNMNRGNRCDLFHMLGLTFEDFHHGLHIPKGKLAAHYVAGGMILKDTDIVIK